jgi:hypothetical protein
MDREACKAWFAENYPGRELAKSSCLCCPYRSPKDWQDMKRNDPDSFREACRIDEGVRDLYKTVAVDRMGFAVSRRAEVLAKNAKGERTKAGGEFRVPELPTLLEGDVKQYILRECIPLRDVDSLTLPPEGPDPHGIRNECSGMCGL